jgi:adenine/guanine phosphoribosyltransferase-like PRPP-binding protein
MSVLSNDTCEWLREVLRRLSEGDGVSVVRAGGERVLRIEWLNLYNEPAILRAVADAIVEDARSSGISYDAVASIETSGAKYGIAVSLRSGVPYFSIHKVEKVIFEDPIGMDGESVTEARPSRLFLDRSTARRYPRVLLVDDIVRSSRTAEAASRLLRAAGSEVVGCYSVLDLMFAEGRSTSPCRSLIVVDHVDDHGRVHISGGLAPALAASCGKAKIEEGE